MDFVAAELQKEMQEQLENFAQKGWLGDFQTRRLLPRLQNRKFRMNEFSGRAHKPAGW
jgi:hypothetical protein